MNAAAVTKRAGRAFLPLVIVMEHSHGVVASIMKARNLPHFSDTSFSSRLGANDFLWTFLFSFFDHMQILSTVPRTVLVVVAAGKSRRSITVNAERHRIGLCTRHGQEVGD